ncbi:MAG: redoxin domain-containing protein [Planctomycetota bacterium]
MLRHMICFLLLGLTLTSVSVAEDAVPEASPPAVVAPAATPPAATPAAPPAIQPGHSLHGEVFDEGPRQKAYLMSNTGKVNFPTSSKVPECQQFINQGVGQLHGFWYFEAERSFRQAAALDPNCAIAYWGMAMANTNNEKRAKAFIAEAVKRKKDLTPREDQYIESLENFYKDDPKKKNNKEKDKYEKYTKALERIYLDHPEDLEAKAFLCFQLWDNRSHSVPITSNLAVSALIKEVLSVEPQHPAHHYMIHLWDYEKAELALPSAAKCGQAASSIAHMWHMPGHIFSRVERYAEAAWQQEASARVDHAYMQRDRVLPDQIHNFAHNNEWLIRDLSFVGRVREGIDLAKNMSELPRHPKYNTMQKHGSSYYGRLRLFEELSRYELWEELISLSDTSYLEPTDIPLEQIKRLRHLAVAKVRRGDTEGGTVQLAALEERLKDEVRKQTETDSAKTKKEAEEKAKTEAAKPAPLVAPAPALPDAATTTAEKKPTNPQIQALDKAIAEVQGHLAVAGRDFKAGLVKLREAGDVDAIYLARVQLQAGEKEAALKAARDAVSTRKNQTQPLAALVELLILAEEPKEAKETFDKLRAISTYIDIKGSPVFSRLIPFAAQHGLPEDWRDVKPPEKDVGERPALDSLGPFRWQPQAAPEWIAENVTGEKVGLAQFRGKPLVLIFFLGHGCLHCSEQLQAFAPKAAEFGKQGITLVGVSTDGREGLEKSLKSYGEQAFPFALLSNPTMDAFKTNRAFDDFENRPLHATLLIDAQGLVRWQDISHEPFRDTDFLLREAKRLLPMAPNSPSVAPTVAEGTQVVTPAQ